jgi:hypothetical protein
MRDIFMTLTQAINFTNTLYNLNSTPPGSTTSDYLTWTVFINIAINLWEKEEGMLWKELYVKLADATDGVKSTTTGTWSYATPTNFVFPNAGYVWIGTGVNKVAVKVIEAKDKQLYENNGDAWCYFLLDTSPTLEFNQNWVVPTGTLNYEYYKTPTQMSGGTDVIDMSDPMFAVYYTVNELNKDTGDQSAGIIAQQKMEGMRTRNEMNSPNEFNSVLNGIGDGMGVNRIDRSFGQ